MKKKILFGLVVFVGLLWLNNTSAFIDSSTHITEILAHRGVHQTFRMDNLENDTCTAERVYPAEHGFMENTIASMRAAFDAGAVVVQLDIHLTTDGEFAVFHDWTVDCRTNGTGVTEELDMAYLKTLDIGYGYTSDGGKTFPLRGSGVGLMPTLDEVFAAFPNHRFLVNFKSNRAEEGVALAQKLLANPDWVDMVTAVSGGSAPVNAVLERVEGLKSFDKRATFACLGQYEAIGWSGVMPDACNNKLIGVPANLAWGLWGWPHRFTQRMWEAGSRVILLGPFSGKGPGTGIDTIEQISLVPEDFDGLVWTDRVETIGDVLTSH